jgi:myo-inositol-1(or 4)-monophosphatase
MSIIDPSLQSRLGEAEPCFLVAMEAATEAQKVVRQFWDSGFDIRFKGNADLVTDADLAAESAIAGVIRSRLPGHAMLGEETLRDAVDSEHLWVIDPIDGTTNFAHRIPHFAVSIAYVHRGIRKVGVVVNPITDDWHVAVAGHGAYHGGRRCKVSQESRLDQTVLATGFYYDRGRMMEATLATVGDLFRENIHGIRRFGTASLDLAFVSRGLFGGFFEYRLSPWDHAAGALLVTEAGGRVTDCRGEELPWTGPSSVLASNGLLHDALFQAIAPHFPVRGQ